MADLSILPKCFYMNLNRKRSVIINSADWQILPYMMVTSHVTVEIRVKRVNATLKTVFWPQHTRHFNP